MLRSYQKYKIVNVSQDGVEVLWLFTDGPENESRCWRDFPHPPRTVLEPTQHPYDECRVFLGVKTV